MPLYIVYQAYLSPPCPFTAINAGILACGSGLGRYRMAGTLMPNCVAYVIRSAVTPGAGSKRLCAIASSAGRGFGTNRASLIRVRCADSCARHGTTERKIARQCMAKRLSDSLPYPGKKAGGKNRSPAPRAPPRPPVASAAVVSLGPLSRGRPGTRVEFGNGISTARRDCRATEARCGKSRGAQSLQSSHCPRHIDVESARRIPPASLSASPARRPRRLPPLSCR